MKHMPDRPLDPLPSIKIKLSALIVGAVSVTVDGTVTAAGAGSAPISIVSTTGTHDVTVNGDVAGDFGAPELERFAGSNTGFSCRNLNLVLSINNPRYIRKQQPSTQATFVFDNHAKHLRIQLLHHRRLRREKHVN